MYSLYVSCEHPLPSCLHDVFAQYGGWERKEEEDEEEEMQGGVGMSTSLTDVPPSARDAPAACCTFGLSSLQPSFNTVDLVIEMICRLLVSASS